MTEEDEGERRVWRLTVQLQILWLWSFLLRSCRIDWSLRSVCDHRCVWSDFGLGHLGKTGGVPGRVDHCHVLSLPSRDAKLFIPSILSISLLLPGKQYKKGRIHTMTPAGEGVGEEKKSCPSEALVPAQVDGRRKQKILPSPGLLSVFGDATPCPQAGRARPIKCGPSLIHPSIISSPSLPLAMLC